MSDSNNIDFDILPIINRSGLFGYENGMTVTEVRPGCAEGILKVGPTVLNPHGTVHGGALYTLADTVAGTAACAHGASCVTLDSSMEFLRPATGPTIRCVATPKKQGQTITVMQVVLTNEAGKEVATGTFTFYMTQLKKD